MDHRALAAETERLKAAVEASWWPWVQVVSWGHWDDAEECYRLYVEAWQAYLAAVRAEAAEALEAMRTEVG